MPTSTPSTVSFTVRRPTPTSRNSSSGPESDRPFKIPALPPHITGANTPSTTSSPLARSRNASDDELEAGIVFPDTDDNIHHTDSSDEDSLLPGSERGQRFHPKRKTASNEAPLVIPTQPNPDWREAARRRRAACSRVQTTRFRATPFFVPDSALAATGADGSVGGLGTRGVINGGPQLVGLHVRKKETEIDEIDMVEVASVEESKTEVTEETEDQRALRAILAGQDDSTPVVEIIPVPPLSEADALKQDVEDLPDVATADDYERVPISAFGAAMLRGMGWTGGAVAPKSDKRSKNALSEPYLPHARPALLGIGAKEREPDDDGSGKKKPKGKDMRYVPVVREDGGGSEHGGSRSGTVSRRSSRSPSRRDRDSDRTRDRDRGRERSAYDDRERKRDRDRRDDNSRRRTREYDEKERERTGDPYRGRGRNEEARRYDDRRDRARERDRRDR